MTTNSLFDDLDAVDRDGAVRETAEQARMSLTRRGALMAGGSGAAALTLGFAGAGSAGAATSKLSTGDITILNYALTLEYLEAAFYAEALAKGALSGPTLAFAKVVAAHEATHVTTITNVITGNGSTPTARPTFDFRDTTASQSAFQKTSLELESTGVQAYLGQGALVESDVVLGQAVAILAVEARHQAWISDIIGRGKNPVPAPAAFATPLTMSLVLKAVNATGFIVKAS